jgi:hypothetical protein
MGSEQGYSGCVGKVQLRADPDYVGKFPIREDIEVLPPDKPAFERLGFMVYEEIGTSNNCFDHSRRAYDTDLADQFFSHHMGKGAIPDGRAWTVIPVLEFLNGKPWNNLALNALVALRPSAIRVTTGGVTCDCWTWRATVFLDEKDGRTIRRIEQEVDVGTIGCKTGDDFSHKVNGIPLPEPSDEPLMCHCIPEALKKANFS